MLRDVNITVNEGGISGGGSAEGVHVKIGVSPLSGRDAVTIKGTYSAKRIVQELGSCPLADACMDSVENGADLIYCIPVAATVDGVVSAVTKTPADSAGTGTVTLMGKPNNAYSLVLGITMDGELNAGAFRWSLNGGLTYSEESTIPLSGSAELTGTGLTAAFVPGETGFKDGDTFKANTTAPTMNNEGLITAMERLRAFPKTFELVHVTGPSTKAQWAAAAAEAATLEAAYKKPVFFVFEAPAPTGTAAEYKAELATERAGFSSKYVEVVAARALYTRMNGMDVQTNLAGVVCGMFARATVQQSIGEVSSFPISDQKIKKLLPEGIEDYISDLDDEGYLTFRQYYGLTGYYVNNARMMAPEGSDYQYAERMRVSNKIIREVRRALLPQLQQAIDITRVDSELAAIASFAMTPLDKMKNKGEISSARINIPKGQDILTSETMEVEIFYIPVGYIREIKVALAMENPMTGGSNS